MELSDEQYRKVMRKGWNLTVPEYQRSWTGFLGRFGLGCVERAALLPGERVLDVACGPGLTALAAAARVGPSGAVLGTDVSEKMIEAAAAQAAAQGLGHARFARMPMEQLEVEAGVFDAALCAFGLMFAAPLPAALAGVRRALRPGGRFLAAVWGRRDRCGFAQVFPVLSARLQLEVCPLFFALGPPGAATAALERAGFSDAREQREELAIRWRDGEDACRAMFQGGPGAYPYSLFAADERSALDAEWLATLAPFRSGEGYEVPAEFVTCSARVPDA